MTETIHSDPSGAWYLGGHLLHPGGDPLGAARVELSHLLAGAGPDDLLVLAGSALGWHARAVLETVGGPRLLVYEPDPDARRAMDEHGPACRGLEVAPDPDALAEILADHLVYGQVKRVAVFAPPAYQALAPEVVAQAKQAVSEASSRRAVDQATRRDKNLLWLEHLAINFKHILELPDPTGLAGAMAGVPCLVVGAGPSLDQSLEALAAHQHKALIVAAASALAPLRKKGVYPHVAVALEAKDESRQFSGADFSQTVLAAASASHPRHFSAWPGLRAMFHLQPWMAELSGKGLVLPSGGHAGSAGFSLAILWGCDPVILVGQDLAYTGGRFHAGGRPGGEDYQRPDLVDIPAIGGGLVPTSAEWLSYLGWYQEAAGYLARKGMAGRVINATAAGAAIAGFDHNDLSQVLGRLAPMADLRAGLFSAIGDLDRPQAVTLRQGLARARQGAEQAAAALDAPGPGLARELAKPGSAASWVLEGLNPMAENQAARDNIKFLLQRLEEMEEVLRV